MRRVSGGTATLSLYKHAFLGLLILSALVLGYSGFGAVKGFTPFDRVYDTLELFYGKFDSRAGAPDWQLNAARFLAFWAVIYGFALAIGSASRDEIQALRARLARRHIIVCGLGDDGLLAAKNLRKAGHRVVAIEEDAGTGNISRARKHGLIVLKGDAKDKLMLRAASVARASHLVVMCGSDGRNAEVVAAARDVVTEARKRRSWVERVSRRRHRKPPVRCVMEIGDNDLADLLNEAAFASEGVQSLRLEYFNVAERGAEAVVDAHSPFSDASAPVPHVVIVGLGEFGSAVVERLALAWRARRSGKLPVTVIDRHADRNVKHLCARNPGLEELCDFRPLKRYIGDPDGIRDVEAEDLAPFVDLAGVDAVTHAYVCLADDADALSAGVALHRCAPALNVVIRTSHQQSLAELFERRAEHGTGSFTMFDVRDYVCKEEVLLAGPYERLARAIHQRHRAQLEAKGAASSLEDWEHTTESFIESSRAYAEDIGAKLEAINFRIARLTDWTSKAYEFTDAEIETMAEHEHARWMAERLEDGWQAGDDRDVEAKIHPLLKAWDELDDADKEWDRELVAGIPALLAEIGYTVEPVARVGTSAAAGAPSSEETPPEAASGYVLT